MLCASGSDWTGYFHRFIIVLFVLFYLINSCPVLTKGGKEIALGVTENRY